MTKVWQATIEGIAVAVVSERMSMPRVTLTVEQPEGFVSLPRNISQPETLFALARALESAATILQQLRAETFR